jgi:hypothetical protein
MNYNSDLFIPAKVTLNASGYGFIRFAPAGTSWKVTSISVKATTATLEATVAIYRRQIGTLYIVDGTNSGSTGDTTDSVLELTDGEPLFVEWTGADANVVAYATLRGMQTVPERGFRAVS